MSVQNPNEGNSQTPAGTPGQPASPVSGGENQPLPEYIKNLQSQIESLTTQVKGVQKGTDKQIGQVRSDVKRILELKESGMDERQIQRELMLDDLLQGQNPPVQTPAGSGTQNTGLDVEPILKSLQFPDNDVTLAALKVKYSNDPQGLLKAAAEVRLAQATSPSPSTATMLPQTSGTPVSTDSVNEVTSAYETELRKIPRGQTMAVSNLKAKYRALAKEKGFILNI